jgi:hypothetical protein
VKFLDETVMTSGEEHDARTNARKAAPVDRISVRNITLSGGDVFGEFFPDCFQFHVVE